MSTSIVKLNVFHRGQLVQTREVEGPVVKIGRLGTSHLFLDDPQVARMHAVVEVNGDDVRVVDLGSSTGTRVNGRPVSRHEALRDGDALEIGPYAVTVAVDRAVAQRPLSEDDRRLEAPSLDVRPFEDKDAPAVAEVMGMYGRTVLDVRHVSRSAPQRRWPTMALGAGALAITAGLALFAHDAAQDWDAWRAEATAAADSGRAVPQEPGWGLGGLGIALTLMGLVPLVAGGSARREQTVTDYVIGEHPDAAFHADLEVPGGLPLVRNGRLGFTRDMEGRVYTEGTSYDLRDLVAQGRATRDGEFFTVPLPSDARCRLQRGPLVFYVNSVAPGRSTAGRSGYDRAFWTHTAGSAVALGGIVGLLQLMPDDGMTMGIDDATQDNRFVGYLHQPDETPEPPPEDVEPDTESDGLKSDPGQRNAGPEGKMGDPRQKATGGQYRVRGPKDATPTIARNFSPEMEARREGILGVMEDSASHWLADPSAATFTVGNDDEDIWGNLVGADVGPSFGNGALGLVGTGRRGGGTAEGTIGFGNVGTIGSLRRDGGRGLHYNEGRGVAHASRTGRKPVPRVAISKPRCQGGCLDKDVIRRVVRAHINEVRHCYNQGLSRDPGLRGRVAVQFRVAQNGKVQMAAVAESTLGDSRVGACVAQAVRRWRFPSSQASSIVTYPFALAPAS